MEEDDFLGAGAQPQTFTLEEVRARLAAVSKRGKADQVKALLQQFGTTKLTEVDPARYGELMTAAEQIA